MKSLVIVSHPAIDTSLNQQFFKEAMNGTNATWHHLEEMYPDGQIDLALELQLSLIHISEPTRRTPISYAVFCLKKKKKNTSQKT